MDFAFDLVQEKVFDLDVGFNFDYINLSLSDFFIIFVTFPFYLRIMTKEEINEALLLEIIKAKETNELSDELKILFYRMCRSIVESEKYKYFDDDKKYSFVLIGYKTCTEYVMRFNPQKSNNAYMYFKTIIRNSIDK